MTWIGACVVLVLLPGCAKSVSLEDWQRRVDEFVWQEANGDVNLLREQTLGIPGSGHRGMALLGDTDVQQSTDVYGVLLGHRQINGRPMFVFLVGVVAKQTAKDIRLVTLSVENAKSVWQVSEKSEAALEQYLEHRRSAWAAMAGDEEVPPSLKSFPAVDDVFRLEVEGGQVNARHVGSGATWTMRVAGASAAETGATRAGAD